MTTITKTKVFLVSLVVISLVAGMIAFVPAPVAQVKAEGSTTPLNQSLPINPLSYEKGGAETHENIPTLGGSGDVF